MFVFATSVFAQTDENKKDELEWLKFNEGLEKAKNENKKVIIDFYTDWCGWCKVMDQKTYSVEKIKKYLREYFVLIRFNPELEGSYKFLEKELTGAQMAQVFNVSGFPSTAFLRPDGKGIGIEAGYIPPEDFYPLIRYVGGDHYTNMKWEDFVQKYGKE
jgi:thioredoxin-related protein